MDLYELINSCLEGDTDHRITGLDIANHVKSPFITYCNEFVSEEEQDPSNTFLEHLTQKGILHEEEIIEVRFPIATKIEVEDQIQSFKLAIKEMFAGVEAISNVPLLYLPLKYVGRIDLLQKQSPGKSIFGDYHYEICEIKVAKHIKDYHIMQAIYYNEILGRIQQYTPDRVQLINNEGKTSLYEFQEYKDRLYDILGDVKKIRNEEYVPIPCYNGIGAPWTNYSNKLAEESDDVSCLIGVGPSMQEKLHTNGFNTLNNIDQADLTSLTAIKGIGNITGQQFKNYARSLLSEERLKLKAHKLSSYDIEIFIDFEGVDPTLSDADIGSFDYLFGAIIRNNNLSNIEYFPFLITDPDDEEERRVVFGDFLKLLRKYNNSPIYHWHSYEKTRMKTNSENLNISNGLTEVSSRLVDLYKVVKGCWVFPLKSFSIKDVAQHLGFTWTQEHFDGRLAITKYLEFLKYPFRRQEIKSEIITYNKDDIKALIHVLDWLFSN